VPAAGAVVLDKMQLSQLLLLLILPLLSVRRQWAAEHGLPMPAPWVDTWLSDCKHLLLPGCPPSCRTLGATQARRYVPNIICI
jgi:hypothetical protein